MPTVHVVVTADHISNGQRKSSSSCPVALAIREHFPNAEVLTPRYIYIFAGRACFAPESVRQFIRQFDILGIGEPFEFDLSVADAREAQVELEL